MADKTSIEWTRGDDGTPGATWNPVTGCTKVSPGCDNCYAETFAERWRGTPGHHFEAGFDLTLRPSRLDQPLKWTRPRRIFVNSMSDLFHDDIPDSFLDEIFGVMAVAHVLHGHQFQVLTKRHGRMRSYLRKDMRTLPGGYLGSTRKAIAGAAHRWAIDRLNAGALSDGIEFGSEWPLPGVWLGVSVEDQKWANVRIPALLETPAAVRWLSCEPLLGPIDLGIGDPHAGHESDDVDGFPHPRICLTCSPEDLDVVYFRRDPGDSLDIDWVVVGGESGRNARPMHPDWARSLRDQCVSAEIPFLFKQWGEWCHSSQMPPDTWQDLDARINLGQEHHPEPHRVGKKRAGRLLDERTWDEYPAGREAVVM